MYRQIFQSHLTSFLFPVYTGWPLGSVSRPLQSTSQKSFKLDIGKSFQDRVLLLLMGEERTLAVCPRCGVKMIRALFFGSENGHTFFFRLPPEAWGREIPSPGAQILDSILPALPSSLVPLTQTQGGLSLLPPSSANQFEQQKEQGYHG